MSHTLKIAAVILLIFLLFASNTWWFLRARELDHQVATLQKLADQKIKSQQTLDFMRLFIDDVLNAKGDISFETRLHLENAVRDLKDQPVLDQWNKFLASKNEDEAQTAVKTLLSILVHGIGQ